MKKIDPENIDEIMFNLLEGEYSGAEKDSLLEAIEADPVYSELWSQWQKTKLSPEWHIALDFEKLKKKKTIHLFNNKFLSIAASIILLIGISLIFRYLQNKEEVPSMSSNTPLIDSVSIAKQSAPAEIEHSSKPIEPISNSVTAGIEKSFITVRNTNSGAIIKTPENAKRQTELALPHFADPRFALPFSEDLIKLHEIIPIQNDSSEIVQQDVLVYTQIDGDNVKRKQGLIRKIFGNFSIKIVPDTSARLRNSIVVENQNYRLIAGSKGNKKK